MKTHRPFLTLSILCLGLMSVSAQSNGEVTFTISVKPKVIRSNQPFKLIYNLSSNDPGTKSDSGFRLPQSADLAFISTGSSSSEMTYMNGKTSNKYWIAFHMAPRGAGDIYIAPITMSVSGHMVKSNPLTIHVRDERISAADSIVIIHRFSEDPQTDINFFDEISSYKYQEPPKNPDGVVFAYAKDTFRVNTRDTFTISSTLRLVNVKGMTKEKAKAIMLPDSIWPASFRKVAIRYVSNDIFPSWDAPYNVSVVSDNDYGEEYHQFDKTFNFKFTCLKAGTYKIPPFHYTIAGTEYSSRQLIIMVRQMK